MDDTVLLHSAFCCSEELRNEIRKLCKLRKDTISQLNSIARKLHEVHKDVNITKVVGSSVGIAGGALALTGLVLAPFSFGASLTISVIGSGIAAAGGVTSTTGVIVEKIISSEQLLKAQYALEADIEQVKKVQAKYEEFEELCGKIEETLGKVEDDPLLSVVETSGIVQLLKEKALPIWVGLKALWKAVKNLDVKSIAMFFWNIFSLGKGVVRVVTTVFDVVEVIMFGMTKYATNCLECSKVAAIIGTKGFFVFNFIFQIFGIGVDIYTLITTIIDMEKGSKSEAGRNIEGKAKRLEEEMKMWEEAFLTDRRIKQD